MHPGHTLPTTIGEEWEHNPFIRIWRGLDPEGDAPCTVRGEPATLILWAPDYDGTNKAWVRYPGRPRRDRRRLPGRALMGWKVERIEAVGSTAEPGFWEEWAREPDFGGRWQSIGDHFGIAGFGVNANVADDGRELIVPHSETEYGRQEELYVMLRGRARFTCDGEAIELAAGEMMHVSPRSAGCRGARGRHAGAVRRRHTGPAVLGELDGDAVVGAARSSGRGG